MDIRPHTNENQIRLELAGRFTFDDHKVFKIEVTRAIGIPGTRRIVLDMTGLNYIDSSALGALLLMKEHAEAAGVTLSISHPNHSVLKILKVVNFDKVFDLME